MCLRDVLHARGRREGGGGAVQHAGTQGIALQTHVGEAIAAAAGTRGWRGRVHVGGHAAATVPPAAGVCARVHTPGRIGTAARSTRQSLVLSWCPPTQHCTRAHVNRIRRTSFSCRTEALRWKPCSAGVRCVRAHGRVQISASGVLTGPVRVSGSIRCEEGWGRHQ